MSKGEKSSPSSIKGKYGQNTGRDLFEVALVAIDGLVNLYFSINAGTWSITRILLNRELRNRPFNGNRKVLHFMW